MSHFTIDSLRESAEKIGQIYPVIKDAKGNILDGYHRKRIDPNWKEIILPIEDELESLQVRIHLNNLRRTIPVEEKKRWIKLARQILQKRGFKGTQKEIANALGMTRQWVTKYDEMPIRPITRMPRRSTQFNYNVLGFKSPERLGNDLKTRIIEAVPNEFENVAKESLESAIYQAVDGIDPFFFIEGGDPKQPDKEFYHGATPAFIIESLIERYKPQCVLDSMAGTGTTGYVCAKHGISCDQFDLYPYEKYGVKQGDAETIVTNNTYDLIFNHIPYLGMVKYGEDEQDLSNLKEKAYFNKLQRIFKKNHSLLIHNGVYAVLVGDWRHGGQLIPITAKTTILGLNCGFKLWDKAVKLTSEMKSKALQEYRSKKFGYFAQMYDVLLIFKKEVN